MLNLDTNVVIAFLTHSLRRDERWLLEDDYDWGISAMVLWEMTKLWQLKKIDVAPDNVDFRGLVRRIRTWPLSIEVAHATLRLDFSSDPADEIIAATSLVHGAPLVTRDTRMTVSKVVPIAVR